MLRLLEELNVSHDLQIAITNESLSISIIQKKFIIDTDIIRSIQLMCSRITWQQLEKLRILFIVIG